MTYKLGTEPIYSTILGQPVYKIDGADIVARAESDVYLLALHHTNGTDSRKWLATNPLRNSATYLVGAYPDTNDVPRCYKYLSERLAAPQTQGAGKLGGLPRNVNYHAISIEVEGGIGPVPFRQDVLDAAAKLGASILKDWHDNRARSLLVIGHDQLDSWLRKDRHTDPHFDLTRFVQQMYAFVGGLSGNVPGWGKRT